MSARLPKIRRRAVACRRCKGSGREWHTDPASLQARRKAAGLSLRELALRAGLSAMYLCDVELGRRRATDHIVEHYEALEVEAGR